MPGDVGEAAAGAPRPVADLLEADPDASAARLRLLNLLTTETVTAGLTGVEERQLAVERVEFSLVGVGRRQ